MNNIPGGWKLVPVNPTNFMVASGDEAYSFDTIRIYSAMLAAAPEAPAPTSPKEVAEPSFYWVSGDEGSWNSPKEWAQDYYDNSGEHPESVTLDCAIELGSRTYDSIEFDADGNCVAMRLVEAAPATPQADAQPVAPPKRMTYAEAEELSDFPMTYMNAYDAGLEAGLLYTHPDAGEIEHLKTCIKNNAMAAGNLVSELEQERDTLRGAYVRAGEREHTLRLEIAALQQRLNAADPRIDELMNPVRSEADDALVLTVDHQQFIAGEFEDLIDEASDFQDRAYALGVARGILRSAAPITPQ